MATYDVCIYCTIGLEYSKESEKRGEGVICDLNIFDVNLRTLNAAWIKKKKKEY